MLTLAETPPSSNLRPEDFTDSGLVWTVVNTRPNMEKEAVRRLQAITRHPENEVHWFLPYCRTKRTFKPLFPRYLFVSSPEDGIEALDACQETRCCLSASIAVLNQDRFRREIGLLALYGDPHPEDDFPNGTRVKFRAGHPYYGMTGIVGHEDGRLYVDIYTLGQKVSVKITEPGFLEEYRDEENRP